MRPPRTPTTEPFCVVDPSRKRTFDVCGSDPLERPDHDVLRLRPVTERLSAQLSGPLADQLRNQGEAASALVKRLQEDLRASEEAVRKVHHHLIDASRFILSKVEYRR